MKFIDKLKYLLFHDVTSKCENNTITLFIGDINNKLYFDQLCTLLNNYIPFNCFEHFDIALSFIGILKQKSLDCLLKDLNELNSVFKDLKFTIHYKYHNTYYEDDYMFVVIDIIDVIDQDIYFHNQLVDLLKENSLAEDFVVKNIGSFLLTCAFCNDPFLSKVAEFVKNNVCDINDIVDFKKFLW